MGQQVDLTHRSAIEFNLQIKQILESVYRPLSNYGVKGFTYARTFKGGKKLYLSSSQEWVELYIKNSFQNDFEHLKAYVPSSDITHALWSGFKRDKVFDALYECDLWNGFTVYEHHTDYVDFFDFFSNKENGNIVNFYINNIDFLKALVNDFKKIIKEVIDFEDKSKLIVPKHPLFSTLSKSVQFVEEDKIKNFMKQIRIGL